MEPSWDWQVGDPIGLGNDIGAPEVPYMSYGPKIYESEEERIKREEEEEKQNKIDNLKSTARMLSREAWKLYREDRLDEALIFISRALEYCEEVDSVWNINGVILESMKEYEEALNSYDRAIEINSSNELFRHNKAVCLISYCYLLRDGGNADEGLDKINIALKLFETIDDKRSEDEAWYLKAEFLEMLDDIPQAFNCYKKAFEKAGENGGMKETYRQNRDRLLQFIEEDIFCPNCGNSLKATDNYCIKCGKSINPSFIPPLKKESSFEKDNETDDRLGETVIPIEEENENRDKPYWTAERLEAIGRENLITIAGSRFHNIKKDLLDGTKLILLREPDNVHDGDAIAVYFDYEKIGYVSNRDGTNSPFSSKASELKGISDAGRAEYLVKYGRYHLARIIR